MAPLSYCTALRPFSHLTGVKSLLRIAYVGLKAAVRCNSIKASPSGPLPPQDHDGAPPVLVESVVSPIASSSEIVLLVDLLKSYLY